MSKKLKTIISPFKNRTFTLVLVADCHSHNHITMSKFFFCASDSAHTAVYTNHDHIKADFIALYHPELLAQRNSFKYKDSTFSLVCYLAAVVELFVLTIK